MGAQFSRFVIFCRFFVFLGDPSKIAVLPAWELNSVCIPPPPTPQEMHPGGFSDPLGSKTLPHGPKTPPNHDFGTILDVFWTDFGRFFGIILEVHSKCFHAARR